MTRAIAPTYLRAVQPAAHDDYDRGADIADVLEAATRTLDGTDLTEYQQLNMTRLFPRRTTDTQASWHWRIDTYLDAIADDLRPWWQADNGAEVDQQPVPQWRADQSRAAAELLTARLIGKGTL